MKSLFIALTACVLPFAAQAAEIINIDGTSSSGTTISLKAGTYAVSVIGTSQGGAYNGWDDSTANFGTPTAFAAINHWKDSFTITANSTTTAYVAPNDPHAASDLLALTAYQTAILDASSKTTGTVMLTLGSAQSVTFTVSDNLFVDNWGGESLSISPAAAATPEPATFGMMGLALAGVAGAMRRKFAR